MYIENHKQLAEHIVGKRILHLNSYGKDSIVCLEWLAKFANVEIISLNFKFMAAHPKDKMYLKYLKRRYPDVQFIHEHSPQELNQIIAGIYQSPIAKLTEYNHFDHYGFDFWTYVEEMRQAYQCDFICVGESKYESVTRASLFYKKGLCFDNKIYPIGFMSKAQIFDIIKQTGVKLHPCYKTSPGTYDFPSYYKMRSAFIVWPEYRKIVLNTFPLLVLDEYRYTQLLKQR